MGVVNWSSPVNWNHPLNHGLVSWWLNVPHWQGGTVFRDLTRRFDGTLTNMAPASDWVGPGNRPGGWGALALDGADDHFTIPDVSSYFASEEATFFMWIRINNDPPASTGVSGSWLFSGAAGQASHYPFTDNVIFDRSFVTSRQTIGEGLISDLTAWHSICIKQRAGTGGYVFYQNAVAAYTANDLTWNLETSIKIGESFGTSVINLDGFIDDARLYNRWLSDAEVLEYHELSQQFYPGLLNRRGRRVVIAAAAGTTVGGLALAGVGI